MNRTVRMVLAGALWTASCTAGAAQSPTSEQLEIFRNLSPEQQQAVLEELAPSQREDSVPDEASDRPANVESGDARPVDTRRPALQPEIPVMLPLDTLLVEAHLPEDKAAGMNSSELEGFERLRELIRVRNPYQLDRSAQLHLPGIAPIALSGLNETQATQRLALEPSLLNLEMRLTRLPVAMTGVAGLKPFGYDLFDNAPSTFSPVTNVPVPADYVIGPGDQLSVQLYGNQNRTHRLTVSRDGMISFPELGPIPVGGLSFTAVRQEIEARVAQQMIGVRANVSMGDTRTIRVFVSGEARRAGSYVVDGLATMITALFASGGVTEIGSLRDIQLKRQGQVIRRFDLYDLLIRGDTSDDAKLMPGDVIFIPPVGPTVTVDGEVKRPAIYELREETGAADLVRIAGGLTPEADAGRVSLTRLEQGRRVVVDVGLDQPGGAGQRVGNGDVLRVARLRPQIDAGVEVDGFVHRPGLVAWREGLRLTQVIGSVDELKPNADQRYVLIRRESGPERRISILSADLAAALAAPGSAADIALERRDRIHVFDLAPGREHIVRPLLEELMLQSDLARPTEIVRVGGRVKVPGEYPLEPGMRVSDLLRAGGNLHPGAYGQEAELARSVVTDAGDRRTELISIDLVAVRQGDATANIILQPFDHLIVRETPDWSGQESVTLRGEVRFPGTYPIRRGETLRQVVERAGGLTTLAFPEGSAFSRRDLREMEQRELNRLARRTRSELYGLSLQAANAGQLDTAQTLLSGQSMLAELLNAEATGRLVIDLPGLLAQEEGSVKDVTLRDGDELFIPKRRQEVSVIGEVQNVTAHLFMPDLARDDYISLSGGVTKKADRKLIYIVRADGSVARHTGSWLARSHDLAIKPGDTIVVPLDTERMPRLPFWQAVTQILYNVAVSVAAVNSF